VKKKEEKHKPHKNLTGKSLSKGQMRSVSLKKTQKPDGKQKWMRVESIYRGGARASKDLI